MQSRVRVKICGITRPEDVTAAVDAGADAIGLVFYAPSPRSVSIEQAEELCCLVPPFVTVVGLFVNHPRDYVEEAVARLPLGLLQFHGDETPEDCKGFGMPYIKAVRMQSGSVLDEAIAQHTQAQGFLVDAYKKGVAGGTGETFDWELLPKCPSAPLILAGGLNPENVRSAIACVHPYAVDVSGGVEQKKGVKDHALISQFIKEVSRGG